MDQIQAGALTAGQTLNEVTGYKAIEKLKLSIEKLEDEVLEARAEVREAKRMYSDAISERSNSQREVNELLQRKHNWTPADLERFTELYRNDHANEHSVNDAKKRLGECEHHVEDLTLQLSKQILTRYHEEQIWSDKIRRVDLGNVDPYGIQRCLVHCCSAWIGALETKTPGGLVRRQGEGEPSGMGSSK